jgi:hypothetical protein
MFIMIKAMIEYDDMACPSWLIIWFNVVSYSLTIWLWAWVTSFIQQDAMAIINLDDPNVWI